ncbi:MAG: sulfur oxidation c-type cytochrome SoxA [Aquificae bacterium]|nr:sulfur oxidation c-type cytochrome SoxA [Aquificota bacterium]
MRILKISMSGVLTILTTFSIATAQPEAISPEDWALYQEGINPGEVFAEEIGGELFNKPMGSEKKSCASCHNPDDTKFINQIGKYPKYQKECNKVVSLQQRVQMCQAKYQKTKPFSLKSEQNVALVTYLKYIASGTKIDVDTSSNPVVKDYYEYGKEVFRTKRGKRYLSCQVCHEFAAGRRLRMQWLKPLGNGSINGVEGTAAAAHWPGYRMTKSKVFTIEQRFQQCMKNAGMKKLPLGSKEMVALELYITSLSNGAEINAPGLVR